jgi:hypothetical protein
VQRGGSGTLEGAEEAKSKMGEEAVEEIRDCLRRIREQANGLKGGRAS